MVVELVIRPFGPDDGALVAAWRYPPPYDIYDADSAIVDDPAAATSSEGHYAVLEAGEVIGFFAFGVEARVPGGDYLDGPLDVGLASGRTSPAAATARGSSRSRSPSRPASSAPRAFARPSRRSTSARSGCARAQAFVGSRGSPAATATSGSSSAVSGQLSVGQPAAPRSGTKRTSPRSRSA
jgi:hypothetical protein